MSSRGHPRARHSALVAVTALLMPLAACAADADDVGIESPPSSPSTERTGGVPTSSTSPTTPERTTERPPPTGPVEPLPSTEAAESIMECADAASLAPILAVLGSGHTARDDHPAVRLGDLIARNRAVITGSLSSVSRRVVDGSTVTVYELDDVSTLVGDVHGMTSFKIPSTWPDEQGDPLASAVDVAGVDVVAFLDPEDDEPWTVDVHGFHVGCGGTDVTAVLGPLPDDAERESIEALAEQIRTLDPIVPVGWTPECVELSADPTTSNVDAPVYGQFGPLGSVPALDITVPRGRSERARLASEPAVGVQRVDGGTLISVRPSSSDWFAAWMLALVGDDGEVRWRRCFDGASLGFVVVGPTQTALVLEHPRTDDHSLVDAWRALDVRTGNDLAAPDIPEGLGVEAISDRHVVFGRKEGRISVDDDRLHVLDVASGSTTTIPYLERANGQQAWRLEFRLDPDVDDGSFRLFHMASEWRQVAGVFEGGAWRTDDASILAATDVWADASFEDRAWSGRNAIGEVLWTRPELLDPSREGFRSIEVGDLTLLDACAGRTDEQFCVDGSLVALETASGEIRWQLPGQRAVPVAADGFAIVSSGEVYGPTDSPHRADGYLMVDVETGRLVDDTQRWPGLDTFRQGCCGEGEFVWVARSGGVVFAVDGDHVRVWFPQGVNDETISVALWE
ncbi:MAG: hypothetical protein QNJ12_05740 [Ilumatobacter sp.]|nr:hypothetical protein [Ilumatobacter sp.]